MSKKLLTAVCFAIFTTIVYLPNVTEGGNVGRDYLFLQNEAMQILRKNPILERELKKLLREILANEVSEHPELLEKILKMKDGNGEEIDRLFELIKDEDRFSLNQQRDNSGMPLTGSQMQTIGVILDDFQVNEIDTGRCDNHWSPNVAVATNGTFTLAWRDYRNGNSDIYCQRYDNNGTALGSNFLVNDDAGGGYQSSPTIGVDGEGNFVIAWQDDRNGNYDIYCQRYDNSGTVSGSNFLVNDDVGGGYQSSPSIGVDGEGNFVITWCDDRNGNWDIGAQRYDADGTALGSNFMVNDDEGSSRQNGPTIVVDVNGNFMIVWDDYRNGNYDIYAQLYNAGCTALGSNFIVNDDEGDSRHFCPTIGVDGEGNFVIAWQDERNGNYDIYCQRYDENGTAQDSNYLVNDDIGGEYKSSPSVGVDGEGNFIIAWEDRRSGNTDIYCQLYNAGGTALCSNFRVNDDVGSSNQILPTIGVGISGNFVIAWQDNRNGNADIYCQRYNDNGTALGSNFLVNDDIGSGYQSSPTIGVDGEDNFMIAWTDNRNGNYDIYCQRYDANGTVLGYNFLVNDDGDIKFQTYPTIGVDGEGNFIIAWEDNRNGNYDIYCQRYNENGTTLGSNFRVNNDWGSSEQYHPTIGLDSSSNFVIAWVDNRNGNADIYAQRYDIMGVVIGSNIRVSDDEGSSYQFSPTIGVDREDNFVIAWVDNRNGNADIYATRFDNKGNALCSNFMVNDDDGSNSQKYPTIGMDSRGNFEIAWEDDRNGNYDIYCQRYKSSGDAIESNFILTTDGELAIQQYPSTVFSNGKIYTAWVDNRIPGQGMDIFTNVLLFYKPAAAYFTGEPIEGSLPLTVVFRDLSTGDIENWTWDFGDGTDTSYTSFADSIIHIYENNGIYTVSLIVSSPVNADTLIKKDYITTIINDISIDTKYSGVPEVFSLDQNYPNPFNPITAISYELPKSSLVKIAIYDINGRLVETLLNEIKNAGYYSVELNAKDFSSGIYFYQIMAGNYSAMRKMIVMK